MFATKASGPRLLAGTTPAWRGLRLRPWPPGRMALAGVAQASLTGMRRAAGARRRVADHRRYALRFGCVVAAYYLAAHIGYAFQFSGPVAAIVWLPVGVWVASLYGWGLNLWPAVVAGDLLVNDYGALPLGSAFGQSIGNTLEVVLAAALMRRLLRDREPLGTLRGVGVVLAAAVAGTALSATVGVVSLRLGHAVPAGSFGKVWRTWWLGDLCGCVIVVPLVLAWRRAPAWPRNRDVIEGVVMLGAVIGASELAFGLSSAQPVTYLVFPGLIWAALRFGPRGTSLVVAVVAGLTLWGTTHDHGGFAVASIDRTIFESQLYLLVAAASALAVAALGAEREELTRRLHLSRARVVLAADDERRRVERDLHDGAQQRLVALATRLRLAGDQLQDDGSVDVRGVLERGADDAVATIEELRELARGLHPPLLRTRGLASALQEVASRSGLPVELVELPAGRIDGPADVTAYFVVSESLANCAKHASASRVRVAVGRRDGDLDVLVEDDGVGGAAESQRSGLQGLRDRVEAVGGTFSVVSPRGAGTRVRATIPLAGS